MKWTKIGDVMKLFPHLKGGTRSLLVIVLAAILLEMISAIQYYYSRALLERELEARVLTELQVKGNSLFNTLNTAELKLQEHLWDIREHLDNPDSLFSVVRRMIVNNQHVVGSCLAFVPNYYPEKGRLFEPYAYEDGDSIIIEQLGMEGNHDYTKHPAFQQALIDKKPFWSDPYDYKTKDGVQKLTTYSYTLVDAKDESIAVCGMDVSLLWLGDTLNAKHFYPSSFDLFLTKDGQLIAGPSESAVSKKRMEQVIALINDSTEMRETVSDTEVSVIEFHDKTIDDDGYIYYTTMSKKPNWQVVVVCYDDEVYGALKTMRLYIALLMLAGFLLVGLIINRTFTNMIRLQRADMEKERISGELRIAQNIQMSMLPKTFPPYPDRKDIDVYGSLTPAKEVGGDLFDFYIRDEKLFFCIGDVSGKGVPAAMVMARTNSLFRLALSHDSNPARIMHILNKVMCQNNESNMFITFFIGVLDLPTGRLRYCNAGHDKPVVIGEEEVVLLSANAHLPLAVFPDVKYEVEEMVLPRFTTLFLYTDGLTEAMDSERRQFGLQRVMEVLQKGAGHDKQHDEDYCHRLIARMTERVKGFVKDAEQSDDLTMLAIQYKRVEVDTILDETLTLKNDVRQVPKLGEFIKGVMGQLEVDSKLAGKIRLAVEEAVVNAMEYAYPSGQEGNVTIRVQANGQRIKFTISDEGVPFDPTAAAKADTSLSVEDRPIGGLGIMLVRELMDSINYEREEGRNILTLRKVYK